MLKRAVGFLLLVAVFAEPATAARLEGPENGPLSGDEWLARGQTEEAIRLFRLEAASATALVAEAEARNKICVLEADRGRYQAALPDCERTLELSRELLSELGKLAVARALNNLGRVQQGLGLYEAARGSYEEALALNREEGDAQGRVINWINLGIVADRQGRYGEALRLYDLAFDAASLSDEAWAREQQLAAQLNRGAALTAIGAHREALELYRSVEALVPPEHKLRRAVLLVNEGGALRNLGDPIAAREQFEEASRLLEERGDWAALANALINRGLVEHKNLKRPVAAEAVFRRALELAQRSGDRAEEIQALYYLAGALADSGQDSEAAAMYQQALGLAEEVDSAEGRWSAAEGLGRLAEASGRLDEARRYYLAAIDQIEGVRRGLGTAPRRAGFFGSQRPAYSAAVRVLSKLHSRAPLAGHDLAALDIVQRAKSRDLAERLGFDAASKIGPSGERLRHLVDGGRVLEFFLGEEYWYVWEIRSEGIRHRSGGEVSPLVRDVGEIHRALSRGEEPSARVLVRLSHSLLGEWAEGMDGERWLAIAGDGLLRYLPFEILPVDDGLLLDHSEVFYLPSLSVLAREPGSSHAGDGSLVGFAPLVETGGDNGRFLPAEWARLPALRFSSEELRVADRSMAGWARLYEGPAATESAFRDAVGGSGAAVVHLASHTLIDERRRDAIGIVLAKGDADDGILAPAEIAAQRVSARLTLLAACRTALSGPEADGQALNSLYGAFLAAGSEAVLATLWDVDDESTLAFLERLYFYLGRGVEPATALRETKQDLRRDERWQHPALWSAFVLFGHSPAVASRGRVWRWLVAGLLIAALASALLAARHRTRRRGGDGLW